MKLHLFITNLFSFPLLVVGCADSAGTTDGAKALTGYGPFVFGQQFDEAVSAMPGVRWNYVGLEVCRSRMPLDGCFLPSDRDETYVPMNDGVSFYPALMFNRKGELTDITLSYRQEGSISIEQCIDIHERTLDRLTLEHGSFKQSAEVENDSDVVLRKTEGNNEYRYFRSEDGFVTDPMRSHWHGAAALEKRPMTQWNRNAYVSILSTLISVDGVPHCNVSIMYDAPPSVERAR